MEFRRDYVGTFHLIIYWCTRNGSLKNQYLPGICLSLSWCWQFRLCYRNYSCELEYRMQIPVIKQSWYEHSWLWIFQFDSGTLTKDGSQKYLWNGFKCGEIISKHCHQDSWQYVVGTWIGEIAKNEPNLEFFQDLLKK